MSTPLWNVNHFASATWMKHVDEARKSPRVAVCLAGQARSLVDPAVWHSIRDLLIERGRHPLFMVLGTSGESSKLQHADMGAPDACALQHALSALRPRRIRFVLRESPHSCANPATGQFSKWADCVALVREDEAADPTAPRYEYLFKTRPDVLWTTTPHVAQMASMLGMVAAKQRPILSGNDWHLLLPRKHWAVLDELRPGKLQCDTRCAGSSLMLREYFDKFNEYCLMMSNFARLGVPHVEASHPDAPGIMHQVVKGVGTDALRAPAHRIQRQKLQIGNVQLATLCTPLLTNWSSAAATAMSGGSGGGGINGGGGARSFGWRCAYCSNEGHASAASQAAGHGRPRPCPTDLWDQPTEAARSLGAAAAAANAATPPGSASAAAIIPTSSAAAATSAAAAIAAAVAAVVPGRRKGRLAPRKQAAAAAAAAGFGLNCSRRPAWRPPHNASAVRRGFCQGTNDNTPCHLFGSRQSSGSWDTRVYKLRTLRDCADICRTCSHCHFVSFLPQNNDCSWYRYCDVDKLIAPEGGYRSMHVRQP